MRSSTSPARTFGAELSDRAPYARGRQGHTRARVRRPVRTRQAWPIKAVMHVLAWWDQTSAVSSSGEVVQKLFRRDKIGGTETLREAIVDRLEAADGVGRSALIAQQAGEACPGA
jgi:hypothetical protein